jgi:phosphatidylglycerophosphatase A
VIIARPSPAFAFSHPAHVIALGFGAGLSPLAPGTAGTVLAWVVGAALLQALPATALAIATAPLFALGIWACARTGRDLGVSDHRAMVWDEIVAFLLVLAIIPGALAWQTAAFVLFRAFDIGKPPPIRALERRYHGGFGVMIDDLVAAAYSLLVLAVARRLVA